MDGLDEDVVDIRTTLLDVMPSVEATASAKISNANGWPRPSRRASITVYCHPLGGKSVLEGAKNSTTTDRARLAVDRPEEGSERTNEPEHE